MTTKHQTKIATSDVFGGHFDEVKPGDTIKLRCGPSDIEAGKAYGKHITRWGRAIRVKLEDGRFTYVSSFTIIGIGAYWTPDSPLRK